MKEKKRVVILWHNGGRLANQLWLYISVYAYCLEQNYRLENHSFFEYDEFFNSLGPNNKKIDWLVNRLFKLLKYISPKCLFFDQHKNYFRKLYKTYVKIVQFFCADSVVTSPAGSAGDVPIYLAPSFENCSVVKDLENSRKKTIYIIGWLFRNPVGIGKYRKEIIGFFRPKKHIEERVHAFVSPLRVSYEHVVGVHIRQGDYKMMNSADYATYSFKRIREILQEFLIARSWAKESTCFIICSDEAVSATDFSDLNIVVSRHNAVEDLYILASADVLLGSNSTFGAFASYYGNIPFIVFSNSAIDWGYYQGKNAYFENKYCTLVHY